MLLLLMLPVALSATPDYPVTLSAGLGGGIGSATALWQGEGSSSTSRVAVHLGSHEDRLAVPTTEAVRGLTGGGFGGLRGVWHLGAFGFDLGARTGLLANDLREVTQISAGLRWEPGLPFLRAGFVHCHETPWAVLKDQPVASIIGAAPGIRHRSGGELALGVAGALNPDETDGRMGAFAEVAAVGFPDHNGPRIYGQAEVGLSLALGRDRAL